MRQKGFIQVILLAGILVAGLALLLVFKLKPKVESSKPTSDMTANWKTHTNYLGSYSIKYPPSWSLLDLEQEKSVEIYFQPDKNKSVGELLIETIKQEPVDISRYKLNKVIGGLNAKCMSDKYVKTWCYLIDKNNRISILIVEDKDPEYNNILNQILSTFKFTDQITTTVSPTPVLTTSNWKTYTNSNYGYSFKYPSNWGVGSICDGDEKDNLVTRLGPHLLKYPNSDCGTANIPSTVMFYIKPQLPLLPENYSIVEQNIIFKNNIDLHYFELSKVDHSQGGSDTIFQFYIPLANQYLIATTGVYPSATLKSDFNQIISTFKYTD